MWNYNNKVMDYFLNPRNVGEIKDADAIAEVGNMTCGDALKIFLKIDSVTKKITDAKFQTFGCASAIASSSILTEIVIGMTLEEAAKVTNRDIANKLGELPEEKMHCSVMGMEALQAALKEYSKKHNVKLQFIENDDDHDGRIICKCFNVTENKIRKVIALNHLTTLEQVTEYTKAGGACGACLNDIQQILDEMNQKKTNNSFAKEENMSQLNHSLDFESLSLVKKILKIEEVIEQKIKPRLVQDGGDIEFLELDGNIVKVRLHGVCAACVHSKETLNMFVQQQLRQFLSQKIEVQEG